jgi:hypothetical protein
MMYIEWHRRMEDDGWRKHHTIQDGILTIEWRHTTATKADGSPISVDLECAMEHWGAGTTPPPF